MDHTPTLGANKIDKIKKKTINDGIVCFAVENTFQKYYFFLFASNYYFLGVLRSF